MLKNRDYYIQELRIANDQGIYRLYGDQDKLESMTLMELEETYGTMQNYLSDMRTCE